MNQELKNDLIATYWEIKQAKLSYNLVEQERHLDKALHWLSKYVDETDDLQDLTSRR